MDLVFKNNVYLILTNSAIYVFAKKKNVNFVIWKTLFIHNFLIETGVILFVSEGTHFQLLTEA